MLCCFGRFDLTLAQDDAHGRGTDADRRQSKYAAPADGQVETIIPRETRPQREAPWSSDGRDDRSSVSDRPTWVRCMGSVLTFSPFRPGGGGIPWSPCE